MDSYPLTALGASDDLAPRLTGDNYGRKGIYDSLDHTARQIRLIQVAAGSINEKVCCRMRTFDLDSRPSYTALSYTWGSPPALHYICIGVKQFLVRKNLWRFLRQVRSSTRFDGVWFWIDALCINQDHLGERAHQVGLIPEIYKNAGKVLVWLGPAYAESDLVPKALERSSRYGKGDSKVLRVWSAAPGRAVSSLCSRRYWKRLWIFQELMLAREVHLMCGDQVYDWAPFEELLMATPSTARERIDSRLSENLAYRIATDSAATSIMRQIAQKPDKRLLLDLICSTSRLRSLDLRDKVYGLLGVATAGHSGISADYSMNLKDLLHCVLRKHHQVQPPKDCDEVWQQCQDLARSLEIDEELILATDESTQQTTDALELLKTTLKPAKRLEKGASLLTLEWAVLHNHRFVAGCIFQEIYDIQELHKWFPFYAQTGITELVAFFLQSDPVIADLGYDILDKALTAAAGNGHSSIVRLLFNSMKADASTPTSITKALTHSRFERGRDYVLNKLVGINRAAVINAPNGYGHKALHIATEKGHVQLVKQLLADEAIDPDSRNMQGETALHIAAKNGQEEIAWLLIAGGKVDVNANDISGQTPLYVASWSGHEGVAEVLLDIGHADPNLGDTRGSTALHVAALRGNDSVVKVLLDSGKADVEAWDLSGRTALHKASQYSRDTTVSTLLELGKACPDVIDDDGLTALHIASGAGWIRVIETLLTAGKANANKQDVTGSTAMHAAAKRDRRLVCEMLLKIGHVDADIRNYEGYTALDIAILDENKPLCDLLRPFTKSASG